MRRIRPVVEARVMRLQFAVLDPRAPALAPGQGSRLCLSLLAVVVLGLSSCGVDEHDDPTQVMESASVPPLSFESNSLLEVLPLDTASCGGEVKARDPGFELYRDAASFRAAYLNVRPGAAQVPTVDFERYVVVGAFLGLEASCDVKIAITSALNHDEQVDVKVTTTRPAACGAAGALAYPFAFARLNRLDKPYVNVADSTTTACP
jgi:hypothetical protein